MIQFEKGDQHLSACEFGVDLSFQVTIAIASVKVFIHGQLLKGDGKDCLQRSIS